MGRAFVSKLGKKIRKKSRPVKVAGDGTLVSPTEFHPSGYKPADRTIPPWDPAETGVWETTPTLTLPFGKGFSGSLALNIPRDPSGQVNPNIRAYLGFPGGELGVRKNLDPKDPNMRLGYLDVNLPTPRKKFNGHVFELGGKIITQQIMEKLPKAKKGNWIKGAVNPKHKGFCTPMTKSTCTPRRKALARTFKKHHGFHEEGGLVHSWDPNSQSPQGQPTERQLSQIARGVAQGNPKAIQLVQQLPEELQRMVMALVSKLKGQQLGDIQLPDAKYPGEGQGMDKDDQMKYGGELPLAELGAGINGLSYGDFTNGQQPTQQQGPMMGVPGLDPNGNPISQRPMQAMDKKGNPTGPNFSAPLWDQGTEQFATSKPANQQQQGKLNPYKYFGLPYYAEVGAEAGDTYSMNKKRANELKAAGDTSSEQYKAARQGQVGNAITMGAALPAQFLQSSQDVLGPLAAGIKSKNELMWENQVRLDQTKQMADVNPSKGDNSQLGGGTNAAFTKFGKKIRKAKKGAKVPCENCWDITAEMGTKLPTIGSDFKSGNPNVITERGEIVADAATGAVVKEDEDLHSDPSGGNLRHYSPDSAVITDSITAPVKHFVHENMDMPIIADRIMAKYKNPEKEVTHADIADLFNTEDLAKNLAKIDKNITKEKGYINPVETPISQVTSKLNVKTLGREKKETETEIAINNAIVRGPLYEAQERAKRAGTGTRMAKYGTKIAADGDKVTNKQARWNKSMSRYENILPEQLNPSPGTGETTPVTTTSPNGDDSYYGQLPLNQPQVDPADAIPTQTPAAPVTLQPDTQGNYSELRTPYSQQNALNRTNLKDVFKQYGQKESDVNGYYDQISAQLEKGDRQLNPIMQNWSTYGQKKNKDGTFGNISDDDLVKLENSPGFEFMKNIAQKHGKLHFDPNDNEMVDEFEKAANAADVANGAIPHFNDKNTQPFGQKKFGNWHASYSPWVHQSYGAGPAQANDSDHPIIYKNTPTGATPQAGATGGQDFNGITLKNPGKRGYFSEGLYPWQIAGEMATLLDPYEAAPFIKSYGNQNALAADTRKRFTDIQPGINRNQRALLAQTRHNQDASSNANAFANSYTANQQLEAMKASNDANIEHDYNQEENRLRIGAGEDQAKALDTLATRSAKGHSAFTDRWINALSGIGAKKTHNLEENRAAALYQDMFPNFAYNPATGSDFVGSANLTVGGPGSRYPIGGSKSEIDKELLTDKVARAEYNLNHYGQKRGKYGTKVKRVPKKMMKRAKSVN